MLKAHWQDRILQLIQQRNLISLIAAGLFVVLLAQTVAILCLCNRWHTIVVPPTIQRSFWVGSDGVSSEYLSQMSEFFAGLLLDLTPDNVEHQRETLLRYVNPNNYAAVKSQLVTNADRLKHLNLATLFYPANVQVDAAHLSVTLAGDLKTLAGQLVNNTERKTYHVQFSYHDGQLLLNEFSEVLHAK